MSIPIGKRRFRANVYLNLASHGSFTKDESVGRKIRIGFNAEIAALERDRAVK